MSSDLSIYANSISTLKMRPSLFVGKIQDLIENKSFILNTGALVGSDFATVDNIKTIVHDDGNDVALSPSIRKLDMDSYRYYDHLPFFIPKEVKESIEEEFNHEISLSEYGLYYLGEVIKEQPKHLFKPYYDATFIKETCNCIADIGSLVSLFEVDHSDIENVFTVQDRVCNDSAGLRFVNSRIVKSMLKVYSNIISELGAEHDLIAHETDDKLISVAHIISELIDYDIAKPIEDKDSKHPMFLIPDFTHKEGKYQPSCCKYFKSRMEARYDSDDKVEYIAHIEDNITYIDTLYVKFETVQSRRTWSNVGVMSVVSTVTDKIISCSINRRKYSIEDMFVDFIPDEETLCQCHKTPCQCAIVCYTQDVSALYWTLKKYLKIGNKFQNDHINKNYFIVYIKYGTEKKTMKFVFYDTDNIMKLSILEYAKTYNPGTEYKEFDDKYAIKTLLYFNNDTHSDSMFYKYVKSVTENNVMILKTGFEEIIKYIHEKIGVDIRYHMNISQIAEKFLHNRKIYEGVERVSVELKDLAKQVLVGGQIMTANNKSIVIEDTEIYAIDAVSLYPSSMTRIPGYPKGKEKKLTKHVFEQKKYDWYIAKFKVISISRGHNKRFPCANIYDEKLARKVWTNDIAGEELYLNPIDFQMMVEYYGAELEFIEGYYWDQGFNTNIKSSIEDLFKTRRELKRENNKLEVFFKLLMNCCYGKTIERKCNKTTVRGALCDPCLLECVDKYYSDIVLISCYNSEFVSRDNNTTLYYDFVVESKRNITNYLHCGSMILSESKRFMHSYISRVDEYMYYMDTDSMFFHKKALDVLGLDIFGDNIGEFRHEFKYGDGIEIPNDGIEYTKRTYELFATRAIFVAPKTYCIDVHDYWSPTDVSYVRVRMNGISESVIRDNMSLKKYTDIFDMYKDAIRGKLEIEVPNPHTGKLAYIKSIISLPLESDNKDIQQTTDNSYSSITLNYSESNGLESTEQNTIACGQSTLDSESGSDDIVSITSDGSYTRKKDTTCESVNIVDLPIKAIHTDVTVSKVEDDKVDIATSEIEPDLAGHEVTFSVTEIIRADNV